MKVILLTDGEAPVLFPGRTPVLVRSVSELRAHRDAGLCVDLDYEKVLLREGPGPATARAEALNEWAAASGEQSSERLPALSEEFPEVAKGLSPLVMINAVIPTVAEIGQPLIRINGWPGFAKRDVHELVLPDPGVAALVVRLYNALGRSFRPAPDVPGMISARILATIINEAWYTWEQGVSSKAEIDTAMKLGTNYPMGPFEWGDLIGTDRILSLLKAMSKEDERHTPSKSLQNAVEGIKI